MINRPNYGGNTIINGGGGGGGWGGGWGGGAGGWGGGNTNINTNINNVNNVHNTSIANGGWGGGYGGGGWGGGGYGGWGGGGYGGWGGGYGGGWGGAGWGSPYYGNWYRGGWGNSSSFWTGFGVGALTGFGTSALYGGYGGFGYPAMGMYSYFPTWGASTYSSWGLGSVASNYLYSGYSNPYYNSTVIAAQPAQTVVYDYSQPINVTSTPPDAAVADSTEQVFSAARDSFKAGDYQRALDLADQVLKQTPNEAVVHEFRALCLFALKRYDEAAAVNYAVLTAGPGWNWSTLVGLYPNVDTYTNQLRALEAYVNSTPNSASGQFLLAYFYMVQGNNDAAGAQFAKVAQLQPQDQLSASFAKLYQKAAQQPAIDPSAQPSTSVAQNGAQTPAAAPTQAAGASSSVPTAVAANQPPPGAQAPADAASAAQPQQDAPPPPPPAEFVGQWKAQPTPDVTITLNLQADGQFGWEVNNKGQKQEISGQAGYNDNTLALLQAEGPPLIGKITREGDNKFVFAPPGSKDKGGSLTFTR